MNKPKIVACLIVKNEEEMLSRCLDSVKGVDNIYIVDTGSEDNTIEIAKKYTVNVFDDYKWNDNFAEARNHVLSKVKEDNTWVLSIDADEFLHDFSKVQEAVEIAEQKGFLVVDVQLIAEGNGQAHFFPRLFKKDPSVRWEGAVHNHINTRVTERFGDVRITYGYSPAHIKDPDRAMRILKKEVDRTGNAREMFYLGREYWYRQIYKECAETLEKYIPKSNFLAEKADAYLLIARCYWAMGKGDDARVACMNAIIVNPHFKEAVLFMATVAGKGTGDPTWEANAFWWEMAAQNSNNSNVLFIR